MFFCVSNTLLPLCIIFKKEENLLHIYFFVDSSRCATTKSSMDESRRIFCKIRHCFSFKKMYIKVYKKIKKKYMKAMRGT